MMQGAICTCNLGPEHNPIRRPNNVAKFGLSKLVITVGVAGSKDRTNQVCADFWILLQNHQKQQLRHGIFGMRLGDSCLPHMLSI